MELDEQAKIDICARGIAFEGLRDNKAFSVLLDVLQADAEKAREDLCNVIPTNTEEIRRLQNVVWKYKELMGTINGFINEGKMMEAQLDDEAQLEDH